METKQIFDELRKRGVDTDQVLNQLETEGYDTTEVRHSLGKPAAKYATMKQPRIFDALQKGADAVTGAFNKAGEKVTEKVTQAGAGPKTAAAMGTLIQMGPDVLMSAGAPVKVGATQIPNLAKSMAGRAMGLSKMFRKTPFARGQVAKAGEAALKNNVIPPSGNPEVMALRAQILQGKTGGKIGEIRDAAGAQPLEDILSALDDFKSTRLQGAKGGAWDKVADKIEYVKDTVKGLLGGVDDVASKGRPTVVKGKGEAPLATQSGKSSTRAGEATSPYPRPITGSQAAELDIATGRTTVTPGSYIDPAVGVSVPGPKKPLDLTTGDVVVTKGGKADPVMGVMKQQAPQKVLLKRVADAKKEIADSVNWFADNVSQQDAKALASAIEKGLERTLEKAGGDITTYKALKSLYGATKTMMKGLNNELAGQGGNLPISLPALVAGSGTGSVLQGVAQAGAFELAKRRGFGAGAKALYDAAKYKKAAPGAAALSVQALDNAAKKRKKGEKK